MSTVWLLLLLVVFSQSVDSQSTTDDDQVCDGHSFGEMKRDIYRILDNQRQLFSRLGESRSITGETRNARQSLTRSSGGTAMSPPCE